MSSSDDEYYAEVSFDSLSDRQVCYDDCTDEETDDESVAVEMLDLGFSRVDNINQPLESDVIEILTAAENGDLNKVKYLLSRYPSLLECIDKVGYTPLHRACYGNRVEIVEYLLAKGAKIDAKTDDGWQPLHCACYWKNVECIETLIAHGADVNAKDKRSQAPLHLACIISDDSSPS